MPVCKLICKQGVSVLVFRSAAIQTEHQQRIGTFVVSPLVAVLRSAQARNPIRSGCAILLQQIVYFIKTIVLAGHFPSLSIARLSPFPTWNMGRKIRGSIVVRLTFRHV